MLDKGVASVAAGVEELAQHSHCQQALAAGVGVDMPACYSAALATATVAEAEELVRHLVVLATGGRQPEAGSGGEDREPAGIVARALLQQGPGQGNWQLRCPFGLMR